MRPAIYLALVIAATGLGMARPARSQSLGDVAHKEEERRKDLKAPAKVYTNNDLGAPLGPPPDSAKSAAPAPPSETSKDAPKAGDDKSKTGPVKDQAYWAKRRKELTDTLSRDKVLVDAVQSRINALTADFAARGDPVQRAGIERDRLQAVAELGRLQQEIKDTQKALADLDEEAHKAGVPPGWLR
jgi:type IV secretory pathway VirB10-like protein